MSQNLSDDIFGRETSGEIKNYECGIKRFWEVVILSEDGNLPYFISFEYVSLGVFSSELALRFKFAPVLSTPPLVHPHLSPPQSFHPISGTDGCGVST